MINTNLSEHAAERRDEGGTRDGLVRKQSLDEIQRMGMNELAWVREGEMLVWDYHKFKP